MRLVPETSADDRYAPGSDETYEGVPELETDEDAEALDYEGEGEEDPEAGAEEPEGAEEDLEAGGEETEGAEEEQDTRAPYRPTFAVADPDDYVARYGEVLGEDGARAVANIVQAEVGRALQQVQAAQALSAADPYEALVQRNLLQMERQNPGALRDPNARAAAELFAVAEIGQARGDVWGEIERFAQRKRTTAPAAKPESRGATSAQTPAKPAAAAAAPTAKPAPPAARPTRPSVSRPAEVAPARGGSEADAAARRVAKRFGVDIDEARNGVRDARRLATRRAD